MTHTSGLDADVKVCAGNLILSFCANMEKFIWRFRIIKDVRH